MKYINTALLLLIIIIITNCKGKPNKTDQPTVIIKPPSGMIWVESKTFLQGAKGDDKFAMNREKPSHYVTVDGFYIDETEVTNKQFAAFVKATNYITIAERPINWDSLKKQLPPNTPKPHDSILQPGSLVFNKNVNAIVNMENYGQWWTWMIGANWKHPYGSESSIEGKDNYPVVHVALEDALEYCKWANRRLPTEAEWEAAALGKNKNTIYTWGNDSNLLIKSANTWQGTFPTNNESTDGFEFISPVKSYPPNSIGLYDMIGNVWEITTDLFNMNYYQSLNTSQPLNNPTGPSNSLSSSSPYQIENVMKGGSFLCHQSYCASFRISARMGVAQDSGSDHMGFRTVATKDMLKK
ncbi:formylglycine-generating enzyme family protein [uncultured Aquimarina sp.]|uniref:formylglycine-generating enzyme family protein n=1 Tax=uncultured Aquimarina sp. TaxID=575652 RepID=UPI0026392180|nr:formylglycine-generating enzyme family protein [uncultured Aquimarina sp.]